MNADILTDAILNLVRIGYFTLKSMRPLQWYKNVLLFVGLVFAGELLSLPLWKTSILSFICFCLLSGAGYIINDLKDRDKDCTNPHKMHRPIVRHRLSTKEAIFSSLLVIALALSLSFWFMPLTFLLVSLGYLALSLSYTFLLKSIALIDVLTLSFGFVLRAVAGCVAIHVVISEWLIVCSFLLALFLILNKKWYTLNTLKEQTSSFYSTTILDKLIGVTTASLMVSYFIYAVLSTSIALLISIVFATYGIFRYLYLVQHLSHQAESDRLLRDRGMLLCTTGWVVCAIISGAMR